MKTTKRKKPPSYFKGPPPKRTQPDRVFINEDGVECVETHWDDGEVIVYKISHPNEPFFQKIRDELADIPPLNLHETIDELRNENF